MMLNEYNFNEFDVWFILEVLETEFPVVPRFRLLKEAFDIFYSARRYVS